MPRAASPESDSETERIPAKKQKKREESPVDDPMDEDGGEDEEYEIETVLDSSMDVFGVCFIRLSRLGGRDLSFFQDEIAYFVKWKGFPSSENSWVRESDAPYVSLVLARVCTDGLRLRRNADLLISKYLDEKRLKEKAAAKKAAKPRKSMDPPKQDPKKRGRVSTKSNTYSDEEIVVGDFQPITKKQKKTPAAPTKKASVPAKKDELVGDDEVSMADFTKMDRYMHLDSWEEIVDSIDTIERDEGESLYIYGTL